MAFKSKIQLGRSTTSDEVALITEELLQGLRTGKHDGNPVRENADDAALRTTFRVWATLEDATAWVAFMNTLSPPPLIAEAYEE